MTASELIIMLQKVDGNTVVLVPKSHGWDLACRYMKAKDAHRTPYGVLII